MVRRVLVIFVCFITIGCVNYNPIMIEALSKKHQYDSEITEELCEDFYQGAVALKEGPEKAWPWLGKAREIEDMNVIMRKQGAACYEAESRDFSSDLEHRALDAFKMTWEEAEEITK